MLPEEVRWLWFASWVALYLWDDASWAVLSTRQLELVRQTGALSALPLILSNRSSVYAFLGELRTAALLEEELPAATRRRESPLPPTVGCRSLRCAVARRSSRSWSEPQSARRRRAGKGSP